MEMEIAENGDEIRSPAEIAQRALCLFCLTGLAAGAERSAVFEWLNENDLWRWLTPAELGFIDRPVPSRQQVIDMGWQSERLLVLAWSLGLIERLPPPDEQCDSSVFYDILPPFVDVSVQDFILRAATRQEKELWEMCDEMLRLHWEARDAKLRGCKPRRPVDIEIIQERHYGINWVTGYDGLPWDEVTTDT